MEWLTAYQPGYQKIANPAGKHYRPYLYRRGARHYSRISFRTAAKAQVYAERWSDRLTRLFPGKESGIVN
jgi:hypothetical protein